MTEYKLFYQQLVDAGIREDRASIMYDAYRDAHEHGWRGIALEWCGDPDKLMERGLESAERMAAVSAFFFASDGGHFGEGLQSLDTTTRELAERVLAAGWGGEIETAEASSFRVKIIYPGFSAKFLKGPRSPEDVQKLGYSFTNEESEAWPFPNRKQAQAKARVIDRHMGWGLGNSNAEPVKIS